MIACAGAALVASAVLASGGQPVVLLDAGRLAGVRAQLRHGDPALARALAALERDARRALTFGPVSVMDKAVVPPSGDKHDYMSQAPYWWPDPSRAGGRPYVRRDGEHNPEIDRISDHKNLSELTEAVSTLGLAFYLTGREDYAAHAARLLRAWFIDPATRTNPHLRYAQGIPGTTLGRGIGIIETRALPELIDGALLLDGSPSWTQADADALRSWMRAYLAWLVESPNGRDEAKNGNNHETWYDVQVAGLALYTGDRELATRTIRRGRERIARQIEPDGRQPRELSRTRAWNYSLFNLKAFFALATLAERVGVDLWHYRTPDGRSLRRALDFLVPYAAGEKRWTYPAITGFEPRDIHELLRRAAVVWQEPEYRALAFRIGGDRDRLALLVP